MRKQLTGVGVGPANLSLASLLHSTNISNAFLEQTPRLEWHGGMQIPHTTLQVSLFKDLVTLSDPTNPYSFLSYLHSSGRIYHFLNARFESVTRKEFSLYMEWAASLNPNVHFDEEVTQIEFDDDFVLTTSKRVLRSEHIVLGVGKSPKIPAFARPKLGETQFHSADYIWKSGNLGKKRVAVVGGGQSGAEVFLDLISCEGDKMPASVSWISSRTNYLPIDDSAFTNDLFMPCHQQYFEHLGEEARQKFLRENVLASDGISAETLRKIYQTLYLKRFVYECPGSISLLPNRSVIQVIADVGTWVLCLNHRDLGACQTVTTDVVIWATGYENPKVNCLDRLASRIAMVGDEFQVDDHFAALWDGPADRFIFIQNASRGQKGLADPNLSLLAWRSERILEKLTGNRGRPRQIPSNIAWAPAVESLQQLRTA